MNMIDDRAAQHPSCIYSINIFLIDEIHVCRLICLLMALMG